MAHDDEYDEDRPRRRPRDDDRSRRFRDDDDDRPPPKKSSAGLVIGILVGVFVVCCGGGGVVVYFMVRAVRQAADQVQTVMQGAMEAEQSRQNLSQIGSAIQKHHDAVSSFPNNSYDTSGKTARPLLSWRVHILPYLGEDALYKQFKLDEPWDSENNKKLIAKMPAVYASPEARKLAGEGKTFYRGFSAPRGIFEKPPPGGGGPPPKVNIASVVDGTSNTILVIDAGEAVEWTKPDDLDFSPGRPRLALGGAYPNFPVIMVLMADGTVKQMNRTVPDETLRLLIDRQDGKVIPAGTLQ
jgi:Protein of unknown function (DUF1559)